MFVESLRLDNRSGTDFALSVTQSQDWAHLLPHDSSSPGSFYRRTELRDTNFTLAAGLEHRLGLNNFSLQPLVDLYTGVATQEDCQKRPAAESADILDVEAISWWQHGVLSLAPTADCVVGHPSQVSRRAQQY